MKRFLFTVFLVFFFISNVNAQQVGSSNSFFWSAEKNEKVFYLFGVLHLPIPLEHIACSDALLQKIRESDLIFVEGFYDDRAMNELFVQTVNTQFFSEDGRDFKSLKPDLQPFLQTRGLNTQLTYMGYMLHIMNEINKDVFNHFNALSLGSIDTQVKATAKDQGIPLEDLDTEDISAQMVMTGIEEVERLIYDRLGTDTIRAQHLEKMIYTYVQQVRMRMRVATNLISTYLSGNEGFFERVNSMIADDSKSILTDRNQRWMPRLKEAHDTYNTVFVVAGIFHLMGKENLRETLEQEGFTINRVLCDDNTPYKFAHK